MNLGEFIRTTPNARRALMAYLGVSKARLWQIESGTARIGVRTAMQIARFTQNKVRLCDMRPDIWCESSMPVPEGIAPPPMRIKARRAAPERDERQLEIAV